MSKLSRADDRRGSPPNFYCECQETEGRFKCICPNGVRLPGDTCDHCLHGDHELVYVGTKREAYASA